MRRNGRIVTYTSRSAGCRLSVNLAHYLHTFDDGDDDGGGGGVALHTHPNFVLDTTH